MNNVRYLFEPRRIAVIGASRKRMTIGGELFHNIIEGGYTGIAFPVNINADAVQSVASYKSVKDCPVDIDLGIIVVPASSAIQVAKECIDKGAKALVVISSGFSETGEKGKELQSELLKLCRDAGVRLLGPNCMGVVNTEAGISLNAQFSPQSVSSGNVSFLSQSGALGIVIIKLANELGIGISKFASLGNKADVSSNDIIEYLEKDDKTNIIMLYLESFGNPRRFSRIARRVGKKKPIIAVKGGRTAAGFRATQSHTGALLASSDITVDALFRQCGVIRTDTLQEMFDVALLLNSQRVPGGKGVGIVTNAGGAGILASDACEAMGLHVPELSQETQKVLRSFLPEEAAVRNPVDMTANDVPGAYSKCMEAVASDPSIDSLYVIYVPALSTQHQRVAQEILEASEKISEKVTIIASYMGENGVPPVLNGKVKIPSYSFPEDGAKALAFASRYGEWKAQPQEEPRVFAGVRKDDAALILKSARKHDGWIDEEDVLKLLKFYGINYPETRIVSAKEAVNAAREMGGKVVLKALAPGLLHKTEVGGVRTGLDASNIESAVRDMEGRLSGQFKDIRFLVQREIEAAIEMFIGVTTEGNFGPVIACGAGGIYVELMKDISVNLAPLTHTEAQRMLHSLKTYPLIKGYRGGKEYDEEAFIEMLERVSEMVEDNQEISELDLNPVMLLPERKGCYAVDARIRVS
jgi:acetyl coenzyme A synthetase (ADP forming)-like protein